jgi:amino acid permease
MALRSISQNFLLQKFHDRNTIGNKPSALDSTTRQKPLQRAKKGMVFKTTVSEIGPGDVENGSSGEHLVESGIVEEHDGIRIVADQEEKLSRSLSQRHIQMIALAGAIVSLSFYPARDST